MNIASYIDHTVLKPNTTDADIEQLCSEAIEYGFKAVCVPPYYVTKAKSLLAQSEIHVATVIGFPMGYATLQSKLSEITTAIDAGADELDMVHNISAVKNDDWSYLENEVRLCTELAHQSAKTIKIIIETGLLNEAEIIHCCELYSKLNVDYIKTSTGFNGEGATIETLKLIRANLPQFVNIKASGGIRNFDFAKQLIEAGANRLGCSASVNIVKGAKEH
ncbi:MAG: deoxyribose-phosphate aldolase [Chitinophagales bacterium]|nr:deoxyribose-phosphate aldolase [Chitinophagaceae bacterium]MCB9064867.1 deoxyribose-phosphate aldolase [Chitinophagales bacterium]